MAVVETLPDNDDDGATPFAMRPVEGDPVEARGVLDAVASRMFGAAAQPLRVGRFVLIERVGRGAMGVVYAAYDPELDRKVAIKLLVGPGEIGSRRYEGDQRLIREARAAARLDHPNVVTIHEVGTYTGGVYLAMEFVDGVTLRAWQTTRRTRDEILAMFLQAGRGLAAAHAAGVVHRDFKPDNALVGLDGKVRVVDFGLARAAGPEVLSTASIGQDDVALTRTGAVMGTPAYMAPEQHRGEPADTAADQFSFCVALWEAWAGRRPFAGESLATLSMSVTDGRITPPPDGTMTARHRRILERGLAVDPNARHPSMDALLAALTHDPVRRMRNVGLVVVAATGLVGAGLLAGRAATTASDPCASGTTRMADVWNDERRDALTRTFVATGRSFAEATAEQVTRRLDEQADAWVTAHRDACEATAVRREQSDALLDLRMACLDRRIAELGSLATLLSNADVKAVSLAVRTVDALVPVETCADATALRAPVPLPDEPTVRAEVIAIQNEVGRATQLRELGRFDEAITIATDVLSRAQTLGHMPTIADAQVLLGSAQARAGDLRSAAQTLEEATWSAIAGRNGNAHATAATALVTIVGHTREDVDAGARWGAHARAVLTAQHDPAIPLAALQGNLGNLEMTRGDRTAALAYFRESVRTYETAQGPDHFNVGRMLTNVAVVLRQQGAHDEAEQTYARALEVLERALGPGHPDLGPVFSNSGSLSFARGRLDEARTRYEKAIAVGEAALDTNHPQLGHAHNNLGETLLALGDHEGAQTQLRRAIAIWEASLGPRHSLLASPYGLLGRSLVAQGATTEGIAALEHALALPASGAMDEQRTAATQALAQARTTSSQSQ